MEEEVGGEVGFRKRRECVEEEVGGEAKGEEEGKQVVRRRK